MNLLDFFRKREKRKKLISSPVDASKTESEEAASDKAFAEIKTVESKRAAIILQSPKVTEKSSLSSESGVYVFRVAPNAPKHEIKKAVEELYNVRVDKVRVINMPSRLRRFGRKLGFKPGYRKALVKLVGGQKIEYV